ncbi:hypothetical protein ACHQM5_027671 [Ranunculus cassubicifolius]
MVINELTQSARIEAQLSEGNLLSFSDKDLEKVALPHNDPLVVHVFYGLTRIKRVLIDQAADINVMYRDAFEDLGLAAAMLTPPETSLQTFTSTTVGTLGTIRIPISIGNDTEGWITKEELFWVMDCPTRYNAILGRAWTHRMNAVISTLHQVMKFPGPTGGIMELRGNQIEAHKCLNVFQVRETEASTNNLKPNKPATTTAPATTPETKGKGTQESTEVITTIDPEPQPKSPQKEQTKQKETPYAQTEELEIINLGTDEDPKPIGVGKNLDPETKAAIVTVIKKNISCFAYAYTDMPGIDPQIACHHLNVNPTAIPKAQRQRKLSPHLRQSVNQEIAKLKDAGFIRETNYPTWIANIVPVAKPNGKVRICIDFTNLNEACPKDSFPLPDIDSLVSSTANHEIMSMMDGYAGYNLIPLAEEDQDKTAFITEQGIYCYVVMPFGLKNAGATYQRLVTEMFKEMLGKTVEVYVDDMIVKSKNKENHVADLEAVFARLNKYNMKLNPAKCAFGVSSGKFLGYMITNRGIEADPAKIRAVCDMPKPESKRQIQKLNGMIVAINRFISKASDRTRPLLQLLKKGATYEWTEECEKCFQDLKLYLASPPVLTSPSEGDILGLYLGMSEFAISGVLFKHKDKVEKPIYYISKTMSPPETRYSEIEKLALALRTTAFRCKHYFQSFEIHVFTNSILKQVWNSNEMTQRMAKWKQQLGDYHIEFHPRISIKGQVLADFLVEMPLHDRRLTNHSSNDTTMWTAYTDGASNKDGSGIGFVLISPEGIQWEYSIRLNFMIKNNGAEYEALISALRQAQELEVQSLKICTDSQLIVMQIQDQYIAKDTELVKYLDTAKSLITRFKSFNIEHVPRDNNRHADSLAYLASKIETEMPRVLRIEVQDHPAYKPRPQVNLISDLYEATAEEISNSWMQPIIEYIRDNLLTDNKQEAHKLQLKSKRYVIIATRLYRRSAQGTLLICLTPKESLSCLTIIHNGLAGNHSGGRTLALKAMRLGYYWPTMDIDSRLHVKKCDRCQRFGHLIHQPAHELVTISSPWPFYMWGLDIVGQMHRSTSGHIAATDYFTKWIEAAPLRTITEKDVQRFIYDNIITRFGLPHTLVTDNGQQFCSNNIKDWYASYNIQHNLSTPRYAQSNGQAEITNRTVLNNMKKKLDRYKGKWVDELKNVLWAYRSTPREGTGESPFSLYYGSEAIIPTEIAHPTLKSQLVNTPEHQQSLEAAADLEERRDIAHMALLRYQQNLRKKYNKGVASRRFLPGDLVLRQVFENTRLAGEGKLGANWEGPYLIHYATSGGAYHLKTIDGEEIQRPWNGMYLKHYYV